MARTNYWSRYGNRRLSRRRVLGGGAAVGAGAAGLALVGCGDDDDTPAATATATASDPEPTAVPGEPTSTPTPVPTPTTPPPEKIRKEGVLELRNSTIYASINPYKGLDSGLLWGFSIFDHLFGVPLDTLEPELMLGTDMEQPDPQTIIVKVGEAFFHDKDPVNGRRVLATDIKASYDAALAAPGISQSDFWTESFESVEVPDNETVVLRLQQPDAWAFQGLAGPINSSIIPEEIASDPSFMDDDLIGSGRWSFEGHEAGANFTLERNPNWRVDGEPFLEGIQYNLIQDQAQALAAFQAREIDVLGLANALERDQVVSSMGDSIFIEQEQSRSIWYLQMAADGRFADPRIRQAVSKALNRSQMIELFALGEGSKSGIIAPSFGPVQLSEAEMDDTFWNEDLADANALLDAAGFDRSEKISLKFINATPQFSQFAKLAASQLEENLGLDIKVVGEDFGTWLGLSLYGEDFEFISYPTLAYEEPNSYLGPLRLDQPTSASGNWSRWYEQRVHDLVVKQRVTLEAEERFEIIKDIQRLTWELGTPIASAISRITNTAVQSYVKGRQPRTRGSFRLYTGQWFIDKS